MASESFFETNKFFSYRDEGRENKTFLYLAIWLVDDFTRKKPLGNIKVIMNEGNRKSDKKVVKNLSGYYLFTFHDYETDIKEREYAVDIESDIYFPERIPHEKISFDKIKRLEELDLNFDGFGPKKGDTEAKLNDISKLQEGYVVEFCNSDGKIEQRSIASFNKNDKIIIWKKELQLEFGSNSESLFIWENVPGEDKDKLVKYLKDVINLNWVESAKIEKSPDKKIINIYAVDNSVEIELDGSDEKAVLKKIGEDRTYELKMKEVDGKHKVYGSIIRAQNYLVEIILKPKPCYPFPEYATLVRGSIISIVDLKEIPVSQATVKVVAYKIETESDGKGEFVLYFNEIKDKKIKIDIEKNGKIKNIETFIVKGKTNVLGEIVLP